MYFLLLATHSIVRWLILILIPVTCIVAFRAKGSNAPYTPKHNRLRIVTLTVAHIQAVLGLALYVISPVVRYFLEHTKEAITMREIRFFGMEHVTVMLAAIIVLTIGSAKVKRQTTDAGKHKATALWFTIALIMILSSIPWPFSPLIARPWLF